jgi:hypothetical protein
MGNSLGICWLNVGAVQWVSLVIRKMVYSEIRGHFMPIKRPGILSYPFSLDVTTSKLLSLYPVNFPANFKPEY